MSRRSNSSECGRHCPDVIVADGVIEAETPLAFVNFLKSGSSDTRLRRIVFFNSRGGNVVASMVFGHILRGLRIAGVVGRFEAAGDPGPYVGECLSACVYALMGAVRRVAPPGSEVGLHRMSIVENEGAGLFGSQFEAQFRRSADGRRARTLRETDGCRPRAGQEGGIAAARHRPRSHARGNAALVVGDKPILIGSGIAVRSRSLSLTWKRA